MGWDVGISNIFALREKIEFLEGGLGLGGGTLKYAPVSNMTVCEYHGTNIR